MIVNPLILYEVYKKFGKGGIKEANKYLEELASKTKLKVHFVNYCGIANSLNASAAIYGYIFVYAPWTRALIFERSNEVENAFLMTLGHEEGHYVVELGFPRAYFNKRSVRFVHWLNEVHSDYYGLNKFLNKDKEKFYKATDYKLAKKEEKDKDSNSHPSWARRKAYIKRYSWGEDLIEQIAVDTGCDDTMLINKSKEYYLKEKL